MRVPRQISALPSSTPASRARLVTVLGLWLGMFLLLWLQPHIAARGNSSCMPTPGRFPWCTPFHSHSLEQNSATRTHCTISPAVKCQAEKGQQLLFYPLVVPTHWYDHLLVCTRRDRNTHPSLSGLQISAISLEIHLAPSFTAEHDPAVPLVGITLVYVSMSTHAFTIISVPVINLQTTAPCADGRTDI